MATPTVYSRSAHPKFQAIGSGPRSQTVRPPHGRVQVPHEQLGVEPVHPHLKISKDGGQSLKH